MNVHILISAMQSSSRPLVYLSLTSPSFQDEVQGILQKGRDRSGKFFGTNGGWLISQAEGSLIKIALFGLGFRVGSGFRVECLSGT